MTYKTTWVALIGLGGALLLAAAARQSATTAESLLGSAIHQEEVQGNPEAAIATYKKVVAEKGVSRTVAAKALLRMGLCYEKLGQAEARKAFEQVVSNYADQRDVAAQARARLVRLGPVRAGLLARQAWAGSGRDVNVSAVLMPDGRLVTEDGDLTLRDLATGTTRKLTNAGPNGSHWAEAPAPSPDGKQLAYTWTNRTRFHARQVPWSELHVMPATGGNSRVVLRDPGLTSISPLAWSPDGREILVMLSSNALLSRKEESYELAWVPSAGGAPRRVKSLQRPYPLKVSLSPDGRYIAYDAPVREDAPARDIFVISADGRQEAAVAPHAASDRNPVWSPDGKQLVFVSDRTGSTAVWAVGVADGKPQGAPRLVKGDVGPIRPLGFTADGSYYYVSWTGMPDVYVASLDATTGKVHAAPARVAERVGSNWGPAWSPDGASLAFISSRDLVIRSARSGVERRLSHQLQVAGPPVWFPDQRSLLLAAWNPKGWISFHRMDAASGVVSLLHPPIENQVGENPGLSPDGKEILYQVADRPNKRVFVRAYHIDTGQDREIARMSDVRMVASLAVSPDARQVALGVLDEERRFTAVRVVPAGGGEARELFRAQPAEDAIRRRGLAWTPDGRYVIFVRETGQNKTELWRVPAAGGQAERMGLVVENLWTPTVRPDGSQIAFSAGEDRREVWVLENLLAAPAAQARDRTATKR